MVSIGDLFANIGLGFSVAFSLHALLYCFIGVTLGTFVGVLPGFGTLAAIAILMPMTFYLDPGTALIMLAGIYYGSAYGGSTASILLNLPGTANTAVTCLDGYPMTQRGRAGIALFMTTIASFAGSIIGLLMLGLFSPPLAQMALRFGAAEYFMLMLMGLLASCLLSSGSPFRSLAAVALGLVMGIVGTDVTSGQSRFTFGIYNLYDGLPLVAIALGLFGLPELIANAGRRTRTTPAAVDITLRSMLPTREDWRRSWRPILRGTGVGSFFGVLPGTGGLIASFMSYAVEKRIHKDPSQFGKGAIEGVAAPEASNNAAIQTAFIPTLTLGIPGDAVMALMLGVMMIHGITPGPMLITDSPDIFWGLVISFLIGNVLLLILNIPLIGIWVRILTIPYSILYPAIVVFVCIGIYSVRNAASDLFILVAFGAIGYGMRLLRFDAAPFILAFILGPLMEENLRRSLQLSRGSLMTFVDRPISAVFLGLTVLLVCWAAVAEVRRRRSRRRAESAGI